MTLAHDAGSSNYAPMDDEDQLAGTDGVDGSRKVTLSLIIVIFAACGCFLGVAAPMAFASESANAATDLAQKTDLEVLHNFQGSTGQYRVFPGGHLSATLRKINPGSKNTLFLLDHRLEYIVHGEVFVTDGTGQSFVSKPGDLLYLPYGSNVSFATSQKALVYTAIANERAPIVPNEVPTLQPEAYRKWVDDSAGGTPISHFPQLKDRSNKAFDAYVKKIPAGESSAYFDMMPGCFKWNATELPWINKNRNLRLPTWNFCCGVFRLKEGPSFTSGKYNHHDEIDFILDGEFHYEDAEGGKFVVKEGDLVHNPRRMDVHIDTPESGGFLSISMSNVDDFWR